MSLKATASVSSPSSPRRKERKSNSRSLSRSWMPKEPGRISRPNLRGKTSRRYVPAPATVGPKHSGKSGSREVPRTRDLFSIRLYTTQWWIPGYSPTWTDASGEATGKPMIPKDTPAGPCSAAGMYSEARCPSTPSSRPKWCRTLSTARSAWPKNQVWKPTAAGRC